MSITLNQAAEIMSTEAEGSLQVKLQLLKAGFRIMHYYGEKVLAHTSQIREFCEEGLYYCEGCERDRLIELLLQCDMSYFHIYDCPQSEAKDYFDFSETIKTFDVWQMEGMM